MPLRRLPLAETLLAFAGLDADRLQELDADELESRVQLALLVWNAVLLADEEAGEAQRRGEDGEEAFEAVIGGLIADLRTSLGRGAPDAGEPPPDIAPADGAEDLEPVVRYLVVRKLEQHGHDHRPMAEVRIETDGTGSRHVVVTGL